jgi:O-antigen ligase
MISLQQSQNIVFRPLYPVLMYLFISITTLHTQIPILLTLHIETLTLIWALFTSLLYFVLSESKSYENLSIKSLLVGLLFIIAPILTSFATLDYLNLLNDEEYKTLFKMIIFVPCLVQLMRREETREILLNSFIAFYTILALYFLYRYLILHEVREFDLRPQLKIRNGDANFLCTFFSMMIPLSVMKSMLAFQNKQNKHSFLFVLSAVILVTCTILTESRMGLIATVTGLFYLFTRPIFGSHRKKMIIGSIVFGLLVLGLNFDRIAKRFVEMEDKSNSDRVLTWKNGLKVFSDYPLFGVGIHKASKSLFANTDYPNFQTEMKLLDVHNTLIKTLAELGLFGLLFFGILFLWPWIKAIQMKNKKRYYLISSLIILTLSMMTIGLTYKDLFILHLFLIVSLAITFEEKLPNLGDNY